MAKKGVKNGPKMAKNGGFLHLLEKTVSVRKKVNKTRESFPKFIPAFWSKIGQKLIKNRKFSGFFRNRSRKWPTFWMIWSTLLWFFQKLPLFSDPQKWAHFWPKIGHFSTFFWFVHGTRKPFLSKKPVFGENWKKCEKSAKIDRFLKIRPTPEIFKRKIGLFSGYQKWAKKCTPLFGQKTCFKIGINFRWFCPFSAASFLAIFWPKNGPFFGPPKKCK